MQWVSTVTDRPVRRMPMTKDAQCIVCGGPVTYRNAEPLISQTRDKGGYRIERNYGRHKACAARLLLAEEV